MSSEFNRGRDPSQEPPLPYEAGHGDFMAGRAALERRQEAPPTPGRGTHRVWAAEREDLGERLVLAVRPTAARSRGRAARGASVAGGIALLVGGDAVRVFEVAGIATLVLWVPYSALVVATNVLVRVFPYAVTAGVLVASYWS